uniref:Uncharacterized protein n=1 Tax=Nothoprocta perdicaria TaxID=30464 RepID=A0A8C6Z5A8_NOTPE
MAAARYGKGRVVVATHESQLHSPKLAGFLLNALQWLDEGKKGLVGVDASLKRLCNLFPHAEVKFQVSHLTSDMSVYCCPSYSDREVEKIHAFVAEGGGLLIGAACFLPLGWPYLHHSARKECPGETVHYCRRGSESSFFQTR